jgi:hypothetical protein
MNTHQIATHIFSGKSGLRKCQQRLQYLSSPEHPFIQKIRRPFFDNPDVYYLGKTPDLSLLIHIIMVSWVYVWLSKRFEIEHWETEVDFKICRFDAICRIKDGRWFFIELDRASSRHKFKKVEQCTELYEKESKPGSELLKGLDNPSKFPRIMIITDSAKRGLNIRNMFQDKTKNPYGLGFDLHLFSEILKEAKL